MKKTMPQEQEAKEVLVALLKEKSDFAIIQEQGWYRIPVAHQPRRWPPKWLAFYQPKDFGAEAYSVKYFARVKDIQTRKRSELFPNELPSALSDREYYQIHIDQLEQLSEPIRSPRWRRIVFISTTWTKFNQAREINDLFDDSPLEDELWNALKANDINAERQWDLKFSDAHYILDFAVFCLKGQIDIETDGDTWHLKRKQNEHDRRRDNTLNKNRWQVLRFTGQAVRERLAKYCLPTIRQTIKTLGGLSNDGLVPRKFYNFPDGSAEQLTLFESDDDYDLE